jgi:hypothetical protein
MKTRNYLFSQELRKIKLESLYEGKFDSFNDLAYDIDSIINTEAPITLNLLKERLRYVFSVAKISQKALNIINDIIERGGYKKTYELNDVVFWPSEGVFKVEFVRINSLRQVYDVPKEELSLVLQNFMSPDLSKTYHDTLNFFGFEVLTKKALEHFEFVIKYMKSR